MLFIKNVLLFIIIIIHFKIILFLLLVIVHFKCINTNLKHLTLLLLLRLCKGSVCLCVNLIDRYSCPPWPLGQGAPPDTAVNNIVNNTLVTGSD